MISPAMTDGQFPKEKYIPLENNPNLIGRIVLVPLKGKFCLEIDIVFKEGHKIFMPVGRFEHDESEQDCWDWGLQKLSIFLNDLDRKSKSLH
jgi:hypothetical protein